MPISNKTNKKIDQLIQRFVNFLKFRSIGAHALKKDEIHDLILSGWIKANDKSHGSVISSYSATHSKVADSVAPMSSRKGAINFLERMMSRYIEKAGTELKHDIGGIIDTTLMPFTDPREGREIFSLLNDPKNRGKYLGEALHGRVANWRHRYSTIVRTELTRASNYGAFDAIINNNPGRSPEDIYVFKAGPNDEKTCKYCRKFWFNDDGKTPRVYKLSELISGGTNIGRKAADWQAGIDATHPNCFTEGRIPVLTETGWRQIKNIKIGEKVLTHTGKFKKVIDIINEPYEHKKMIKIKYKHMDGIFSVKVTPDHKFLTNLGWIEAKDLTKNHKFIQLNVPCVICGNTCHHKVKNKFTPSNACSKECFSKLMSLQAKDYHSSATSDELMIRASRTSESLKKKYENNEIISPFQNKEYWTPERRTQTSESITARMSQMLKASASTRISREQKLAYGWIKDRWQDKNIVMEHNVGSYAIDIAFINEKIAIEIDGKYHLDRKEHDQKRTDFLNSLGWTVLRFGLGSDSVSKTNIVSKISAIMSNHDGIYSFQETEILDIKHSKTSKRSRIYCLTVEEDESFIARGIVSHNCRHHLVQLRDGYTIQDGDLKYVSKDFRYRK